MKAWQVFKSRKDWCRHDFAQDVNGLGVPPPANTAIRWCAAGAMRRVYEVDSPELRVQTEKLMQHIRTKTRFDHISTWNDNKHQRWNKVKAVLKRLDI